MVQAELMGEHTHETNVGVNVNIYVRDGQYLARGYYRRRPFGETLGADISSAKSRLRHILTKIEDGTYVPPSEVRKRPLPSREIPRLTLYDLCNDFLADKRCLRGKDTAQDYRIRLAPVLEFGDLATTRKRWPLAVDVDRDFVLELRTFLLNCQVTRNGRGGGVMKNMSARQIINCLETFRSALNWAKQPVIRKLPTDFINPITRDLIGQPATKDPLRRSVLPIVRRVELAQRMDDWQILHLSPLLVLPLRPEDLAGMLISDVDWEKRIIRLGTRFDGADFNKGHTNIELPVAEELMPVLNACRSGRAEGPLFRSRSVWLGQRRPRFQAKSREDLKTLLQRKIAAAPAGEIQASNDRKRLVRKFIRDLGGVTEASVGKAYSQLFKSLNWTGITAR